MPPTPPPEPERRRIDRFPPEGWIAKLSLPRTFMGLGGGDSVNCPILDLSETGARILVPKEITKGSQLRIRIEDPKFKEVVEWTVRVVWVNPPPPIATTWVVGMEFVELSREMKLRIQGWRSYYTSDEYKKQSEETPTAGQRKVRGESARKTKPRRGHESR